MITASLKRQLTLKRIIIVTYVLTVLMIAGMAGASETSAMAVTKVEVDAGNQVILVEGYRANACQRRPRPEIVAQDSRTRKIVLKIAAKESGNDYCAQMVGSYQVLISIPTLRLPENVPYEVEFLNSQGAVPVTVTNNGMAEGSSFSTADLTGIMHRSESGFSVQTRVGEIKLQPSLIDLTQYVGGLVDISGHEVTFNLMVMSGEESNLNDNGESSRSFVLSGVTAVQ